MSKFLHNTSYFIKEALIIFRTNLLSNILAILSLGLIFFLFSTLAMSRVVGSEIVDELSKQAEISVYYDNEINTDSYESLILQIKNIKGVRSLTEVTSDEAYARMEAVLGADASVLSYFDESPFSPFFEIEVDLGSIDFVSSEIRALEGVTSVRDNIDILKSLRDMLSLISVGFAFVSVAMGIATIVITSHIIRQGIYNNREHIQTLELLGAPNSFRITPYLIEGLFISLCSSGVAILMSVIGLSIFYNAFESPIPFISMPPQAFLVQSSTALLLSAGLVLGLFGSLFGWVSVKE